MSITPTTLTNGQATAWYDCRGIRSGVLIIAKVTGVATWEIEVSGDESDAKADLDSIDAFTVSDSRIVEAPLSRFLRVKQTAGAGSVIVSIGRAEDADGNLVDVNPVSPGVNQSSV